MSNSRPLRAVTIGGCYVVVSHKLNKDGYFRKRLKDGSCEMFHRLVWQHWNGPIPDGYEVHHVCKNRACFNVKHLELLEGHDHAIEGNENRYRERLLSAKRVWERTKCSGTKLAETFGVTASCGCRWVRNWVDAS